MDIHMIIWLFPIIFMFHDFEEILMIEPWLIKNKERGNVMFQKISERLLSYTDSLTTASLSLGVAGMFILICVITITAHLTEWYYLWFGVFFAFTFHLLIHCVPSFIFKSYVPAIITSVISLPLCCYMIILFLQGNKIDSMQMALLIIIGIVLLVATRLVMQVIMQKFSRWLRAYQSKEE